jgi:hypothetical protein
VQRPRAVTVIATCAGLLLGACGDGGSATPPPAAAGSRATVTTMAAATASDTTFDDGCSPDNAPMQVVAASGPAPDVAVNPESVDSPLPDLAVRRINCAGGWVNLRNEIPADKPVLVWFWAPY